MLNLILAAAFFVGIHVLISGTTLRDRLVERFGEKTYLQGFSVSSVVGLLWLILAYRNAPYIEWWGQLVVLKPLAALVMLLAFILLVLGRTSPSPTVMRKGDLLLQDQPPVGILRITRHPALWAIGMWAAVHLVINGDAKAFVLFGSLWTLTVAGMCQIDAKRQRKYGEHWERYAAQTSVIPFLAIAQGRTRMAWKEIGWKKVLVGVGVYVAFMLAHRWLFGVVPY